jgi:superfamily I DNA/RNA helicase
MGGSDDERFTKARAERRAKVDAVLQSKSKKKIVVAGPGTGKTFLFKEILKGKKNAMTLTFVNSLVEDLSLDLCGLSEVKTLHSFARGIMSGATSSVKVFPRLSKVISEDLEILKGHEIYFDTLFHNREDQNEYIPFYKRRRVFYGHYGFADIIYAAALYLELKTEKIPTFDQVLVDEFQDFNRLEVSLIDLLASKSPILIAGDDDQSLYHFKDASPDHIRHLYSDENKDYASFNLPHCSRCTRVIVGAVNDIIVAGKKEGFLKGRIDKPYVFFEDEKKEADCQRYPKLTHVTCFSKQGPYFIAKAIREIASERREKFSVLIIAPTKMRCRSIARALREKGFESVQYADEERSNEITLMDSLLLLSEDSKCNLGWRIVAKLVMSDIEFKQLLEKTESSQKRFYDLLSKDVRKKVKSLVATFKKVAKGETPNPELSSQLLLELGLDPQVLAREILRQRIEASVHGGSDPATRNISIKITTIQSSKGLAEDYVFIADFDDRFFLEKKQKCSDQKIYDFLVALTRARRKIFLISAPPKEPKFLTWIAKERIEKITL